MIEEYIKRINFAIEKGKVLGYLLDTYDDKIIEITETNRFDYRAINGHGYMAFTNEDEAEKWLKIYKSLHNVKTYSAATVYEKFLKKDKDVTWYLIDFYDLTFHVVTDKLPKLGYNGIAIYTNKTKAEKDYKNQKLFKDKLESLENRHLFNKLIHGDFN